MDGPRKVCPHCDGIGTVGAEDNDPAALVITTPPVALATSPHPAARAEAARCPDCDHPLTEHATPGGECVHAFCSHDQSFESVR